MMNEDQLQMMFTPKYILNEGQQVVFEYLVPFCTYRNIDGVRKVLLKGFAGTGKTFLINRVIEAAKQIEPRINFGMTAPTHKAVKVLKKTSELRDLLDFGTIHSFLGLKEHIDERTGEVSYKPDFNSNRARKIDDINVLIIDESSMLQNDLFEHVETEMRSNDQLLVIYMGDEKQIPPVKQMEKTGQSDAIPFIPARQHSHQIKVLALTEPQRQAKESPIIMYSVAIREQYNNQKIFFDFKDEYKNALERVHPEKNLEGIRQILRQYFCTEEFEKDPDYAKVIAWRNTSVDYFNREIRLLINNAESLPRIIENEKLVMDAPLIDNKAKPPKILLPNNEDVVAKNVILDEMEVFYSLFPKNAFLADKLEKETGERKIKKSLVVKVYNVLLVTEDGKEFNCNIIHEDSEAAFKEVIETLTKAALAAVDKYQKKELWIQKFRISENFAWVKHNYALTAHKSQGSTYDYCISMEWDIEQNFNIEERNRIRYVAATRARHKLYVIK
jgi:exodeoxyribonuclease-5